jgi:hypothetical protein
MGIVTTSSETAFHHPPEAIYDFVTNPANWTKTYPGNTHSPTGPLLSDRQPSNIDAYHAAVARELG